jgi:hypothetical protein
MTVAELGVRMSSAEFTGWMAYAELEPFGPRREDERAGVLASLIANIARGMSKSEDSEPFTPASFFAELAERVPAPEPEPADLLAQIRAWIAGTKKPRGQIIKVPRRGARK